LCGFCYDDSSRPGFLFYVLGEVNSPGAYPLSGRETVLDAIIAAGGVTDAAVWGALPIRNSRCQKNAALCFPVCYREIVQLGDTPHQLPDRSRRPGNVPSTSFCKQLTEMLRGSPKPGCPPCDKSQWPCPAMMPQHIPSGASLDATGVEKLPVLRKTSSDE
jgi:polysaccharide export outer membrane protein